MFHLLWQMRLVPPPVQTDFLPSWFVTGQSQPFIKYGEDLIGFCAQVATRPDLKKVCSDFCKAGALLHCPCFSLESDPVNWRLLASVSVVTIDWTLL